MLVNGYVIEISYERPTEEIVLTLINAACCGERMEHRRLNLEEFIDELNDEMRHHNPHLLAAFL